MELSRITSSLFSLVLELSSSSFRIKKLFSRVFHIITTKDPNLEDLFRGGISVFTTVGFFNNEYQERHGRLRGIIQKKSIALFVKPKCKFLAYLIKVQLKRIKISFIWT